MSDQEQTIQAPDELGEIYTTTLTGGEGYLLSAFKDLCRASTDPIERKRWEAWRFLRFLVEGARNGDDLAGWEPEDRVVTAAVLAWMNKETGETDQ